MTIDELKNTLLRMERLLRIEKTKLQKEYHENFNPKSDASEMITKLMDSMIATARYNAVCYVLDLINGKENQND